MGPIPTDDAGSAHYLDVVAGRSISFLFHSNRTITCAWLDFI